jgi:hypothetical protein
MHRDPLLRPQAVPTAKSGIARFSVQLDGNGPLVVPRVERKDSPPLVPLPLRVLDPLGRIAVARLWTIAHASTCRNARNTYARTPGDNFRRHASSLLDAGFNGIFVVEPA